MFNREKGAGLLFNTELMAFTWRKEVARKSRKFVPSYSAPCNVHVDRFRGLKNLQHPSAGIWPP